MTMLQMIRQHLQRALLATIEHLPLHFLFDGVKDVPDIALSVPSYLVLARLTATAVLLIWDVVDLVNIMAEVGNVSSFLANAVIIAETDRFLSVRRVLASKYEDLPDVILRHCLHHH